MRTDLQNNATLNMLAAQAEKLNGTEFTLEDFTYQNNIVETIMFRHLEQTNFTGITVGHVHCLQAATNGSIHVGKCDI